MRLLPLALLPILILAGCRGNVVDHLRPKSAILAPELIRFGLDPGQAECMNQRLEGVRVKELRLLARRTSVVKQGLADPSRLTVQDFIWVAKNSGEPEVASAVEQAASACVTAAGGASPQLTAGPSAAAAAATPSVPDSAAPAAAGGAAAAAAWLNLGAAATGQAISVDAASVDKSPAHNQGWFRLTNPGAPGPSDTAYLLRIDCTARTITTMALRKLGPTGAVIEERNYGNGGEGPLAVEAGTVMEIAYLALCT